MAEFPALPLWTDAYLGDTFHLTTIEHGAYLLILMAMWRNGGSLPNDDAHLAKCARMTRGQWQRIAPTIRAFLRVQGDIITQGRLTDEYEAVRQRSNKQSDNAKARWLKTKGKGDASASAKKENGNAPISISIREEGKPSSSKKRGSRLPDDWRLPKAWGEWAVSEGMAETDVRRQAETFRDYWRSAPSSRGVKADWEATWRNWVRKALADAPRKPAVKPDHFGAFGAIREVG